MTQHPKTGKKAVAIEMLVGFAQTCIVEQEAGLEAQVRDLEAAGSPKVCTEQISSAAKRAELERALEFIREGDALMVTRLDRLAAVERTGSRTAAEPRREREGRETMSTTVETVIHIVWDASGAVAARVDAGAAAGLLDSQSDGRFRRVLALSMALPPAGPIEMGLTVVEDGRRPVVGKG